MQIPSIEGCERLSVVTNYFENLTDIEFLEFQSVYEIELVGERTEEMQKVLEHYKWVCKTREVIFRDIRQETSRRWMILLEEKLQRENPHPLTPGELKHWM